MVIHVFDECHAKKKKEKFVQIEIKFVEMTLNLPENQFH